MVAHPSLDALDAASRTRFAVRAEPVAAGVCRSFVVFDIALLAGIKLLVHLFIRLLGGEAHANVLDVLADNLVGVVVVAGAGFHIRRGHAGSDRRNRARRLTWHARAIGAEIARVVIVDVADEGCVSPRRLC